MRNVDYSIISDFDMLYKHKVVIYGAGHWGHIVCDVLCEIGVKIEKIVQSEVDSDFFIKGIKVSAVKDIRDDEQLIIILASYDYYRDMMGVLDAAGLHLASCCTIYAFFASLLLNSSNERIPINCQRKLAFQYEIGRRYLIGLYGLSRVQDICYINSHRVDVLIYQPGKVGSATIYESLKKNGRYAGKFLHVHTLTLPFMYVRRNKEECRYFCNYMKKEPRKVISLVRNPFMRDCSSFFEGTEKHTWPNNIPYNYFLHSFMDYETNLDGLDANEFESRSIILTNDVCRMCTEYMLNIVRFKADEFTWFDYEMDRIFGIDIYSFPFDREKGYEIITVNNIEVLLLRLENLNENESIIADFLDEKDFKLVNSNVGNEKIYKYVYSYVRENIVLPQEYVSYYLRSGKAHHFYRHEELVEFANQFKLE